jgi:hypothetical protein
MSPSLPPFACIVSFIAMRQSVVNLALAMRLLRDATGAGAGAMGVAGNRPIRLTPTLCRNKVFIG